MKTSRQVRFMLALGEVGISLSADDVSWNPDVADDMVGRMKDLLRFTLQEAADWEIPVVVAPVHFDDGRHMVDDDEEGDVDAD